MFPTTCPAPPAAAAPAAAGPEVEWLQSLPIRAPMPQSLSTIERSNPPPRRKSCSGCIKAKRRCTLEVPACQRCTQRNLDCIYPNGRVMRRRLPSLSSLPGTSILATDTLTPGWDLSAAWNPTCLGGLQPMQAEPHPLAPLGSHPTVPSSAAPIACSLGGLDPVLEVPDMQLNDLARFSTDMPSLDTVQRGPEPEKADGIATNAYELVNTAQPPITWFIQRRLKYAIDRIRAAPRQMVLENQTPWCHPCLYEHNMPRSMQDAHSSCALSMAKNAVNAGVIFGSIENRVQELVSSPMPSNAHEILARTQALLLYQIIRIFEGDVYAGAAAEETTQALEDSAFALLDYIVFEEASTMPRAANESDGSHPSPSESDLSQSSLPSVTQPINSPTPPSLSPRTPQHLNPQLDFPLDLPSYPLDATRTFWQAWIWQESARRTIVTIFWFVQCYRALRGRFLNTCPGRLAEVQFSFTMSEHLWRAQDPVSFSIAWCSKRRFIIRAEDFSTGTLGTALGDARADEVDMLSKMLVSSFWGIQKTKGWLLSVGGDL